MKGFFFSKVFLCLAIEFIAISLYSQSIQRYSITSAGKYSDAGAGIMLTSNIGELMVSTYDITTQMLTQGFIQNDQSILTVNSENDLSGNINAYPNPASDFVKLQIARNVLCHCYVRVVDVYGRDQNVDIVYDAIGEYTVYFRSQSPGIYFIFLTDTKGNESSRFKFVKI